MSLCRHDHLCFYITPLSVFVNRLPSFFSFLVIFYNFNQKFSTRKISTFLYHSRIPVRFGEKQNQFPKAPPLENWFCLFHIFTLTVIFWCYLINIKFIFVRPVVAVKTFHRKFLPVYHSVGSASKLYERHPHSYVQILCNLICGQNSLQSSSCLSKCTAVLVVQCLIQGLCRKIMPVNSGEKFIRQIGHRIIQWPVSYTHLTLPTILLV